MDIKGFDKAKVLAALYNASKPQGMGMLQYIPGDLTTIAAQAVIHTQGLRFDYLWGRVLKINLEGDELDTRWYDRDNGEGAAEAAILGSM